LNWNLAVESPYTLIAFLSKILKNKVILIASNLKILITKQDKVMYTYKNEVKTIEIKDVEELPKSEKDSVFKVLKEYK